MDVRPDLNRSVANGDAKKKQKSTKTRVYSGLFRKYVQTLFFNLTITG